VGIHRAALVLAVASVVAAALPSPGLFLALGLGLAAIGAGWVGYRRRTAPGAARLGAAAAIAVGSLGVLLGGARVALVLLAIGKIDAMIG
jgi:hypothetical protein